LAAEFLDRPWWKASVSSFVTLAVGIQRTQVLGTAPKSNELGCDQKLASDSTGLSGGFSGQRAWVRIWAPGNLFELVSNLSSCRDKCSDL
jgi:hypothetical protein